MFDALMNDIFDAVKLGNDQVLISNFDYKENKENELLFFFKPECFLFDNSKHAKSIIEMALQKFCENEIEICGAVYLSGSFLAKSGIMDNHYGYINRLSKRASSFITNDELEKIKESLVINPSEKFIIYGGHEFLNAYSEYDEDTLNELWASKKTFKLRSGFYYQKYKVGQELIVLINGFHPLQLCHFTKPDRKIVLLLTRSNTDWDILKNQMVGETFPEKALKISIRGELYNNKEKYGIKEVTIANNFVHLSAGPFEAFYEINNFFSKLNLDNFSVSSLVIYKIMENYGCNDAMIREILLNSTIKIDSKATDLFTFTENMNTHDAIRIYLKEIEEKFVVKPHVG